VHTSVLKKGDFIEGKPHFVENGDRKRIMRLVADDIMDRGRISLRQKDMEKLRVKEGDEVVLRPVLKVGTRLTKGFGLFKKKEE
jgi:arginine/ornithine N-succinyltransferase beta subunit